MHIFGLYSRCHVILNVFSCVCVCVCVNVFKGNSISFKGSLINFKGQLRSPTSSRQGDDDLLVCLITSSSTLSPIVLLCFDAPKGRDIFKHLGQYFALRQDYSYLWVVFNISCDFEHVFVCMCVVYTIINKGDYQPKVSSNLVSMITK